MNKFQATVTLCGVVIFFGTIFGFITFALLLAVFDSTHLAYWVGAITIAIDVGAALTLKKLRNRPDLAPDFLTKLMPQRYADADGYCFHLFPVVRNGELQIHLHYQNRFDQPCNGTLRFEPRRFSTRGLPVFHVQINCRAGEYGIAQLPWPVARKFAGKTITCAIIASVLHPCGRGNELRFRRGEAVATGRASIHISVPREFDENAKLSHPTTRTIWSLGEPMALGFPVEVTKKS